MHVRIAMKLQSGFKMFAPGDNFYVVISLVNQVE